MRFLIFVAVALTAIGSMMQAATAGNLLAGSEWGISGNHRPFIRFEADGRVFGHGGCNRFFGSYEISGGDGLRFGPLGATKMACIGPAMDFESGFFAALEKTVSFRREDMSLVLIDKDGAALLSLEHRDRD